jgi:hypothetical protein
VIARKFNPQWIVVALLAVLVAQCVLGMRNNAPTSDEQNHIARGYHYLVTGNPDLNLAPPFVNLLSAVPLLFRTGIIVPTYDRTHVRTYMDQFAAEFVWVYNDAESVINTGRLAVVLVSVVVACFCYRWASELWGVPAGLLALFLYVFDPNIMAHSQLVTTDLGVAGMIFIATYFLWRFLRWRRNRDLVLAGVVLGLAQASKQSALLLVPIFGVVLFIEGFLVRDVRLNGRWPGRHRFTQGRWKPALYFGFAVFLVLLVVAFLCFWASYRFETGPLSTPKSTHASIDRLIANRGLRSLAYRAVESIRIPVPTYLRGLGWLTRYSARGAPNFLMGQFSRRGWWYYFLVALAIKTPIPTLVLLALGLGLALRSRPGAGRRDYMIYIAACAFTGSMLFSTLNIGYRHILPVLPFLFVLAGQSIGWAKGRWRQVALGALCLWLAVGSLHIFPHYLAYFNELVGGPDNGYKYLVDSNLDWGQDLKGLRAYLDQHGIESVHLAYFGNSYNIGYYQIHALPMPTDRPPGLELETPEVYAISATYLQIGDLNNLQAYSWLRAYEPFAKIGYSIFLYRLPKDEGDGP